MYGHRKNQKAKGLRHVKHSVRALWLRHSLLRCVGAWVRYKRHTMTPKSDVHWREDILSTNESGSMKAAQKKAITSLRESQGAVPLQNKNGLLAAVQSNKGRRF